MRKIKITADTVCVEAVLNSSLTADLVYDALPFKGEANTWGNEIYFSIPVDTHEEPDARSDVQVGDLGYWPTGNAFCIFFGPTPASTDDAPRAASPVNIFGKVIGDVLMFRQVKDGTSIRVEKV